MRLFQEGNEGSQENSDDIIGTESVTVALPGRGFTKVSINTTKIQEQAQAARALYEHAKAMGASFPYIQQSMDALLPLVNFPYSSDVRSTCAQTLAAVMEAACLVGEEQGNMGPVRTYLPLVTQAIAKQIPLEDGTTDMEALIALADSLSEIYHIIYSNRKAHPEILIDFGLANAEQSVQSCIATLTCCLERRSQITAVLSGALTGEDEQHDYAQLLEAEQQLLTPLVDSIGYTLKFHGSAFLPIFEKYVLPVLGSKMENQSDVRATLSAVCLFDDVVEHCGPDAAANYAPRLMQAIATALEKHADEKELVQASVYGIAQMARHAPSGVLSGHLEAIIHRLLALTSRSKDDAGDDVYLLEMAASALAAVTLLGPFPDVKFVPKDRLVDSFLSHLPILQDDDEAKICHAGLCHLIESGVISLSQESVRVAKIIGTVLVQVHEGEDVASPDTIERLSSILFQMQQSLPPSTLQQAFVSMEPEAQQIASSILQEMGVSRSHIVTP
jgi:importin-5